MPVCTELTSQDANKPRQSAGSNANGSSADILRASLRSRIRRASRRHVTCSSPGTTPTQHRYLQEQPRRNNMTPSMTAPAQGETLAKRETPILIGSDKVEGTPVYRPNGDRV